jgi:tRNA A-37 threonylcarbamoyl transferase component Bud32
MKTFLRFIRDPFPQVWLVRVQKEFQSFVQSSFNLSLFKQKPLFTTPFAELFFVSGKKSNSSDVLIKRIRVQKAADYIRRLVFCQGKREFLSSHDMMDMAIKCPNPIGYAFNVNPFSRFDSLFICEFLPEAVYISQHMRTLSESERLMYLKMVARDISLMFSHNMLHKDLHLKNILLMPSDPANIYWIDNDLKKISRREIMQRKEAILHRLMVNIPFCSDKEKKFFTDELFSSFNSNEL